MTTFHMNELEHELRKLSEQGLLDIDHKHRGFKLYGDQNQELAHLLVPPILPIPEDVVHWESYLQATQKFSGNFLIILIQAGSTSIGLWHEYHLVKHKVIKKYVTRGRGKAQTTYLKTRGKSRYGSRLRLQNAKAHLEETNEKMAEWLEEKPVEHIFYSCPIRLWSEVFKATPPPPFPKESALKIPMDVRVPNHEELLRVYQSLCYGKTVFSDGAS